MGNRRGGLLVGDRVSVEVCDGAREYGTVTALDGNKITVAWNVRGEQAHELDAIMPFIEIFRKTGSYRGLVDE